MNCTNCTIPAQSFSPVLFPSLAFALSIIGIFANALLIIVIGRDKKLQSPCFAFIAGSAVGSLIMAMGYTLANLGPLGAWSIMSRTRFGCQFLTGFILKTISIPFNSQVAFLISIDRLFGTLTPMMYRQLGRRYVIIGLSICAIYGIVELIVLLSSQPLDTVLSTCDDYSQIAGPIFVIVFTWSNFFFGVLCVMGYVLMLICGRIKKDKIFSENGQGSFSSMAEKQLYLKNYRAIMPAAQLLCVLYLIFGIAPEIMYIMSNTAAYFSDEVKNVFNILAEELKVTSSLAEIIALSLRSRRFRQSVKTIFGKNNNVVVTLVNVQKQTNN